MPSWQGLRAHGGAETAPDPVKEKPGPVSEKLSLADPELTVRSAVPPVIVYKGADDKNAGINNRRKAMPRMSKFLSIPEFCLFVQAARSVS